MAAAVSAALTGCYCSRFQFVRLVGLQFEGVHQHRPTRRDSRRPQIPGSDQRLRKIPFTGDDDGPAGWSQKLTVRARTDAVVQEIASNFLCQAQSTVTTSSSSSLVPDSLNRTASSPIWKSPCPSPSPSRPATNMAGPKSAG
jgi:hypothetical protein